MKKHIIAVEDTPEAAAGRKVCDAIAENRAVVLTGLRSLTWQEVFTLAAIGSALRRSPSGSTYTVKRFVFDVAQRIGNAFFLSPSVVEECLDVLQEQGLIEMQGECEAVLTPVAKSLLTRAANEIK